MSHRVAALEARDWIRTERDQSDARTSMPLSPVSVTLRSVI